MQVANDQCLARGCKVDKFAWDGEASDFFLLARDLGGCLGDCFNEFFCGDSFRSFNNLEKIRDENAFYWSWICLPVELSTFASIDFLNPAIFSSSS